MLLQKRWETEMQGDPITAPTTSGPPKWMIYGGIAAAAVGIFMYTKSKSAAGSGTVAAGTSINAALGSLQEEMLNAQGLISTSAAMTQNQLTATGNLLGANQTALANDISAAAGAAHADYFSQATFLINPNDPQVGAWEKLAQQNLADLAAHTGITNDIGTQAAAQAHVQTATTGTF